MTGGPPRPYSADAELAESGARRISYSQRSMPLLEALAARFRADRPFDGMTVAACLHVTAETAVLARTLRAGGAQVALAASNPLSTQDDIAAALAAGDGVAVFARAGVDRRTYYEHIALALGEYGATGPDLVIDDGGDLMNTLHDLLPRGNVSPRGDGLPARGTPAPRPPRPPGSPRARRGSPPPRTPLARTPLGGCEGTTTGVLRLRRMAAEGALAFPVIAASDTPVKRLVDNTRGTGQSVIDGLLRASGVMLAGKVVVVAGFGACGTGIAECARGLGARVLVTEVDPVRALDAVLSGFRVLTLAEAAPIGEVFITATGTAEVITAEHMAMMRDGAILANAGHFDVEIDVRGLEALAAVVHPDVRPHTDMFELPDGRRLLLLAEGRVVNLVAADGHPPEVMDLAFGIEALTLARLARQSERLPAAVHPVPSDIDAEAAQMVLAALGTRTDSLTPAQRSYLASWRIGS
ncbi:adenosylhomocysteinase [Trebonia sp.]|uniref:adenosylhomocysteinase n=1 Tax=Trebonia sp. TaxID=2767075 RepID=UPI003CC6266A